MRPQKADKYLMKSGRFWKSIYAYANSITSILFMVVLASCTMDADVRDPFVVDVNQAVYTNSSTHEFSFSSLWSETDFNGGSALVYDNPYCEGSPIEVSLQGTVVEVSGLQDGHSYYVKVRVFDGKRNFESKCAYWVTVDMQPPHPATITSPSSDTYVSSTHFLGAWNAVSDVGPAGLKKNPYRVRLYDQPACAGSVIYTADVGSPSHVFDNLSADLFYSFDLQTGDNANNWSSAVCSSTTEVDLFAPGIVLSHAGSLVGYAATSSVDVELSNDSWAAYWCLTEDLSFVPTSPADACPGGQGTSNGWHDSAPSSYNLSAGDGVKTVKLWLFDSNGVALTDKAPTYNIILDGLAPGAFAVTGVTGGTDTVIDDRLSQNVNPVVNWSASSGAYEYHVSIINADSSVRCEGDTNAPDTQFELMGCALDPEVDYTIEIVARDEAGNTTQGADLLFRLDITPPGMFSISGVQGGTDMTLDTWAPQWPEVVWTSSTDAVEYRASIVSMTGIVVCAEQSLTATGIDFSSFSCPAIVDGTQYRVLVSALDQADLVTEASNSPFTFRADTQAPELDVTEAPATLISSSTADFEFSVSDALSGISSIECDYNSGGYTSCDSPINLTGLTQGSYTMSIRARDNVGNETVANYNFDVDQSPPVINLTDAPSAFVPDTSEQFVFTVTDSGAAGVATIECQLDGGAWADCVSPYIMPVVAEGAHEFRIRATDNLGHTSSESVTNWFVDSTAPDVNFTSPPTNTVDTFASIDFTAVDNETSINVECNMNSGGWGACTSPVDFTGLAAGTHSFSVRATNAAGLVTTETVTWNVIALTSCKVIYDNGRSTGDGMYTIDPDGAGGNPPISAYCEMTTNGGGWTWIIGNSNYASGNFPMAVSVSGVNKSYSGGQIYTYQGTSASGNCNSPDPGISVDIRIPHTEIYLYGYSQGYNATPSARIDIGNNGNDYYWSNTCHNCTATQTHNVTRSVATEVTASTVNVNGSSCQYTGSNQARIYILKVR